MIIDIQGDIFQLAYIISAQFLLYSLLFPDLWDFIALRAGISADGCKGSEAWGNYHSWNRQWTDLVCNRHALGYDPWIYRHGDCL